jgi:hypothetical protein
MKCKHEDQIPPVVAEWQLDVLCPACKYYCRGKCIYPLRNSPQAPCPFDGKRLPLKQVEVKEFHHENGR